MDVNSYVADILVVTMQLANMYKKQKIIIRLKEEYKTCSV